MTHVFNPRQLPIAAFAQSQGTLTGEERLARFPRLLEHSQGLGGETLVHYSAHGTLRPGASGADEPWLHVTADATLALVCQRCMAPAELPVHCARDFRFVATEALAELEDEDSEEDVLAISKAFDLLELIEDELLMAAPLVPMHAVCPQPLALQVADAAFEDTPQDKPNPFAVLQQLKKKGPG